MIENVDRAEVKSRGFSVLAGYSLTLGCRKVSVGPSVSLPPACDKSAKRGCLFITSFIHTLLTSLSSSNFPFSSHLYTSFTNAINPGKLLTEPRSPINTLSTTKSSFSSVAQSCLTAADTAAAATVVAVAAAVVVTVVAVTVAIPTGTHPLVTEDVVMKTIQLVAQQGMIERL